MAVQKIELELFLELAKTNPVLDVRSPGEYNHAHIPGAYNLALFTDEERKIVGTAYKQESREKAIRAGLEFFGKKMLSILEEAEKITTHTRSKPQTEKPESKIVLVHCWRGGMRSAGVAWLLDLYGFKVYTLTGGYKNFRRWVSQQFEKKYSFNILGGYTGSGKTDLLKELENHAERIIDLEKIALHKGSAFGAIGMPQQPTQEMFENILASVLSEKADRWPVTGGRDTTAGNIWLEDESQRIGLVNIPQALWKTMRQSPVYFIDVPFEERLNYIVEGYGNLDKERLVNSIIRIKKRLGGLETKTAISFLIEEEVKEAFRILLKYYDKHYLKGLNNREKLNALLTTINCDSTDAKKNAAVLLSSFTKQIPVTS
jgi:tRNA 2-selenouridine synthase